MLLDNVDFLCPEFYAHCIQEKTPSARAEIEEGKGSKMSYCMKCGTYHKGDCDDLNSQPADFYSPPIP